MNLRPFGPEGAGMCAGLSLVFQIAPARAVSCRLAAVSAAAWPPDRTKVPEMPPDLYPVSGLFFWFSVME